MNFSLKKVKKKTFEIEMQIDHFNPLSATGIIEDRSIFSVLTSEAGRPMPTFFDTAPINK